MPLESRLSRGDKGEVTARISILALTSLFPSLKFGYFSYEKVLHAMADYATATRSLNDLKAKYDAETKRSADDFNNRYEDFLDVQHKLEPSILRKRQAELEELMDRNIAFRKETDRLLKKAEARRVGTPSFLTQTITTFPL